MIEKDTILVVPSIRKNCFDDFYVRWKDVGLFDRVDLMLVEDNPSKTFNAPGAKYHYSWEDISGILKERENIIPRRSDTVRSFGYLMTSKMPYQYIMTLDDDCYPEPNFEELDLCHKKFMNERTKWFNTLNSGKPRGIPFKNLGNRTTMLNHGLWTNVLDYDAPTQLADPFTEEFSYDSKIVPQHSYFPMCGMNVMWRSPITVLMYHLLMGTRVIGGKEIEKYPFDRFGDIWAGILMKKVCDAHGFNVSSGMPYIRHERASNPFTNLKKEANGLEVNEVFWQYVDSASIASTVGIAQSYMALGYHVKKFDTFPEYRPYFDALGDAMVTWAKLFLDQ